MAHEPVTADDVESQVLADAEAGIQSFSDGTNSVSMAPLKDRLAVVDRQKQQEASQARGFGVAIRQLVPGGTG